MKSKSLNTVSKYLMLIAGSLLFPVAVNCFVVPAGLNTGGFVGLAQNISTILVGSAALTGAINFCFNIPLFVLSWKSISHKFFVKTVLSLIIQSTALSFLPVLSEPILPDPLSNAVFAAVIGGFGIGLCLLSGGCAGGLDILGVYFSKKAPDISVGKISYMINFFVLGWSAFLFSLPAAMYSLIFVVIMYFVSDKVHYQNINVMALIITQNPEIKDVILEQTHRGVTCWKGNGAYTHSNTEILLSVVNKYEVNSLKKIVKDHDPHAFLLITGTKPVLGNVEKRLTD